MPRSATPKPDPRKSILLSARRAFQAPLDATRSAALWLPDYGVSLDVDEVPLEAADEIDVTAFRPCPDEAPEHASQPEVDAAAAAIAQWVFDTYFALVSHRLRIYNRHRRLLNSGATDAETLGRYRLACRLAIEQILRRDLPTLRNWSWNHEFPVLPIFEIGLNFSVSGTGADEEVVQGISLTAVVEVRQSTTGGVSVFNTGSMDGGSPQMYSSNSSDSSDPSSSSSSSSGSSGSSS